jgi:hypothetical protein
MTLFNRRALVFGRSIEPPPVDELKSTFGLWNASLDDAVRYGGPVTRDALQAMNLRHDRKHVVVDTKVHMLLPGMSPANGGWHTDGAPRDASKNPQAAGLPDIRSQEGDPRPNRYHLLVTGNGCLTRFIDRPIEVPIPAGPSSDLYRIMSDFVAAQVAQTPSLSVAVPSCTVVEFDWWDIHAGVVAADGEWRFLIRVCETDYYEPRRDLRQVIRLQTQVYAPDNLGW